MNKIFEETDKYFSEKVECYGASPKGVDWNGNDSQFTRFCQILKVIRERSDAKFTINDLGCGYGELFKFMKNSKGYSSFDYTGYDLCQQMINQAKDYLKGESRANCRLISSNQTMQASDYTVASGIFNIQVGSDKSWLKHILNTLELMNEASKKGFSFNCLTLYSDSPYMKDYLYYADPCYMFDYCKRNFSKNVALLHDYDLYEFTIIVRKA